jgi:hypothetical protein
VDLYFKTTGITKICFGPVHVWGEKENSTVGVLLASFAKASIQNIGAASQKYINIRLQLLLTGQCC